MTQIDFHRAIKRHCIAAAKSSGEAGCEACCLRLYCYTPPCERTDAMMGHVIQYLSNGRNRTDCPDGSDHYIYHQQPCPCTLDMSSALGFDGLP